MNGVDVIEIMELNRKIFERLSELRKEKMEKEISFKGILQDESFSNNPIQPKHYGGSENLYEAIKVIDAWQLDFVEGNILKYLSRYKLKNGIEDLKKAQWYMEHLVNREAKK